MNLKAQMSLTPDGRYWRLYVVLVGRVADWPEARFPASYGIPTLAVRAEALQRLGYRPDEMDVWSWIEGQSGDTEPVQLIGSVAVRRNGGAS